MNSRWTSFDCHCNMIFIFCVHEGCRNRCWNKETVHTLPFSDSRVQNSIALVCEWERVFAYCLDMVCMHVYECMRVFARKDRLDYYLTNNKVYKKVLYSAIKLNVPLYNICWSWTLVHTQKRKHVIIIVVLYRTVSANLPSNWSTEILLHVILARSMADHIPVHILFCFSCIL